MVAIFINLEVRAPAPATVCRLRLPAPLLACPQRPRELCPGQGLGRPGWRASSCPPGGWRAAAPPSGAFGLRGQRARCLCRWVWLRRTHPGRGAGFVPGGKRVPCPSEQSPSPALQTPGRGHRKAVPVGSHLYVASRAGCRSDPRQPPPLGLWPRTLPPVPSAVPSGLGAGRLRVPAVPLTQSHPAGSGGQHEWPGTDREPGRGMWGARHAARQPPVRSALWEPPSPARGPKSTAERRRPSRPRTPGRRRPLRAPGLPRAGHTCRGGRAGAGCGPQAAAAPSGRHPGLYVGACGRRPGPPRRALMDGGGGLRALPAPRARPRARLCTPRT